jgi:hypothetical protein
VYIHIFIDLESGHLFRYGKYATGFTIVDSEFSFLQGRDFSIHGIQTTSGCHTASYPLFLEVKRMLGETNHSVPSGTEVKKSWRCTFTSPYLSIYIDIDIFVNYNWVDTRWQ